jgi:hypothetical protein
MPIRRLEGDLDVIEGASDCGTRAYIIVVFLSLALYNVIELVFIIWGYFKRPSGLYFWSFNVSTCGILFFALGFLLTSIKEEKTGRDYAFVAMSSTGWVAMVSGQSMVLWSRLHLVLPNRAKLRIILRCIIVNSFCMYIPTLVLVYGNTVYGNRKGLWSGVYSIYENIQVSCFFFQEFCLSIIYIFETVKLARLHSELRLSPRPRRLMKHLVIVQTSIILLDAGILGLEYSNHYGLQSAYKAFVYGIKLKMEFTILDHLKEMTTGRKDLNSETSAFTPHNSQEDNHVGAYTPTEFSGGVYPFHGPACPPRALPATHHSYIQGSGRPSVQSRNSADSDVELAREVLESKKTGASSIIGDSRHIDHGDNMRGSAGPSRQGSRVQDEGVDQPSNTIPSRDDE